MFLKKKKPQKSYLQQWLTDADEAYTKTFLEKSISKFEPYASRKVLSKLMEDIRLGETAYAGLERYKHVRWYKVSDTEPLTFRKEVTYDHIKVAYGVIAPVGDDFTEEWEIARQENSYQVTSIKRLHSWS